MWVKGIHLHFLLTMVSKGTSRIRQDIGATNNTTSTTIHHQLFKATLRHLCRLLMLSTIQYQTFQWWGIVWCVPHEVCDVLLGNQYVWKHHVVHESWTHSVIITLGGQLYSILDIITPTKFSLTSCKESRNIISHNRKFFLFTISSEGEHQITNTSTTSS